MNRRRDVLLNRVKSASPARLARIVLLSVMLTGFASAAWTQCFSFGNGRNTYCIWGSGCEVEYIILCAVQWCNFDWTCNKNQRPPQVMSGCSVAGCYNPFSVNCQCLF
jgi:hypothetical protein